MTCRLLGELILTSLAEGKVVKNRVHLDLRCDDVDAELARLLGLAARVLATHGSLTVLAEPEGNELCLLR